MPKTSLEDTDCGKLGQVQAVSFSDIKYLAQKASLSLLSHTDIIAPVKAKERLKIWQDMGLSGDLRYMQKDPELYLNAKNLLPTAKSILVFGLPYEVYERAPLKRGFGRVARYALSRDYHEEIPERLGTLVNEFKKSFQRDFSYRICTDSVPFLERAFAEKSGLGFIGKNSLLITPKIGSYFFIAEMLVDFIVENDDVKTPVKGSCGSCTQCLSACPTQAFVAPYILDARKCISYLTIEKRGSFSHDEKIKVKEWIFGCDVCQEVCPWNHKKTVSIDKGQISIEEILSLRTNKMFKDRFSGTPMLRAKRAGLIRNAICVAVNEGWVEFCSSFEKLKNDESDIVRETVKWGIETLHLSQ